MSKHNFLFYFNWQMNIPFYGILLHELDKILSDQDNQVFILSCNGILRNCLLNNTSDRSVCKICRFVKNRGEMPYKAGVKMFHIEDWLKNSNTLVPEFSYENIEDIKKIVYDDCFIGYGALSSYVSYTRNQEPVIDNEFRNYFNDLLVSEIIMIRAIENLFSEITFKEVYLYNGRWADVRPVYDICKRDKIKVNILEAVNNGIVTFYREVYMNVLPHNIKNRNDIIDRIWEESTLDKETKENLASEFFVKRKNADFVRGDMKIYTSDQQSEKLPDNWNPSKRNVVIFVSSEDEFVALGDEWERYRIYKNQLTGLNELLSFFGNNERYFFYLRIHPNLTEIKYGYHTRLFELEQKYNNISVIPGDSSVSTYKLVDNSEKVIVFGSSVGVEACYWRKPVILLGGTIYYFQDVAYLPSTTEEIKEMVEAYLDPKPILGALKFGFYLMNYHLYTETVVREPYPIKLFGKTLGYGFDFLRIWNSPLLFKIVYKSYNILINVILKPFRKSRPPVPLKGL
ncbi:MAG: hypothetical protein C0412_08755 [Flavobacterium sp.]|nr:hypothetical protein [Flavobacterium sp.]